MSCRLNQLEEVATQEFATSATGTFDSKLGQDRVCENDAMPQYIAWSPEHVCIGPTCKIGKYELISQTQFSV